MPFSFEALAEGGAVLAQLGVEDKILVDWLMEAWGPVLVQVSCSFIALYGPDRFLKPELLQAVALLLFRAELCSIWKFPG